MSTEEKAAAFDTLVLALTNRWVNGTFSWWCPTPCGGEQKGTREQAVADLIAWAERTAKAKARRRVVHPL